MKRLILKFVSDNKGLSLLETHFEHPLLPAPHKTVRGQQAMPNVGTFRWSTGVMGLCVLLLKHALKSQLQDTHDDVSWVAKITGEHGSLASSLDYALSKQPLWLKDMFGITAKGSSLSQLLFRRINPERKRPGPVVIFVPTGSFIVNIYVDGRIISEPKELERCVKMLEATFDTILTSTEHAIS